MRSLRAVYSVFAVASFLYVGGLWITDHRALHADVECEPDTCFGGSFADWAVIPTNTQAVIKAFESDEATIEWCLEDVTLNSSSWGFFTAEYEHIVSDNIADESIAFAPSSYLVTTCSGDKDVVVTGDLAMCGQDGVAVVRGHVFGNTGVYETADMYLYITRDPNCVE